MLAAGQMSLDHPMLPPHLKGSPHTSHPLLPLCLVPPVCAGRRRLAAETLGDGPVVLPSSSSAGGATQQNGTAADAGSGSGSPAPAPAASEEDKAVALAGDCAQVGWHVERVPYSAALPLSPVDLHAAQLARRRATNK